MLCEFGENVTHSFSEIDYTISEFNWYLFPSDVQKILPTLMAFVQKPVEFPVFGSVKSSRESFKNVNQIENLMSRKYLHILISLI